MEKSKCLKIFILWGFFFSFFQLNTACFVQPQIHQGVLTCLAISPCLSVAEWAVARIIIETWLSVRWRMQCWPAITLHTCKRTVETCLVRAFQSHHIMLNWGLTVSPFWSTSIWSHGRRSSNGSGIDRDQLLWFRRETRVGRLRKESFHWHGIYKVDNELQ